MSYHVQVIDVDMLPDPTSVVDESHETEVVFTGYNRKEVQDSYHQRQLNDEGIVYMGFRATSSTPAPVAEHGRSYSATLKRDRHGKLMNHSSSRKPQVIPISDSEDNTRCPSPKRAKRSTTTPRSDRRTVVAREVLPLAQTHKRKCEHDDEEDYIAALAALDLDHTPNWEKTRSRDMEDCMAWSMDNELYRSESMVGAAAACVAENVLRHQSARAVQLQNQSQVFDWSEAASSSRMPHVFIKCQQAARHNTARKTSYPSVVRSTSTMGNRRHNTFQRVLRPTRTLHHAPSHITTVIQSGGIMSVASAVHDGELEDSPGPYNREGTLSVYDPFHEFVLSEHSREGRYRHYYTVNDVAIDPACSSRLASAGRDLRVFLWDCDPMQSGQPPELIHRVQCSKNPEVVRYHPQGSLLAIQCDDGSVYLLHEGSVDRRFTVASPGEGHVTAEMAWGCGPTQPLLFASTACAADGRGFHKAYNIEQGSIVASFDAELQSCSALTLDTTGENLYIATEGPGASYVLRQYNVRSWGFSKKADQTVVLEPFASEPDKSSTDINSLSVSSDGFYIATGRTDNWLDVYDSRMLRRGPLHSFTHEGVCGQDTYGVVKTQWVEAQPYGTGLVSGGIDGCIRLWDVKLASSDPSNGRVLARCVYDVSTFTLGDIGKQEVPIIVGERSGQVTLFNYAAAR